MGMVLFYILSFHMLFLWIKKLFNFVCRKQILFLVYFYKSYLVILAIFLVSLFRINYI